MASIFALGEPDLERDFSDLPKYSEIYKNKILHFRINETSNFKFLMIKLIDDKYLLVVFHDFMNPDPYKLSRLYRLNDTEVMYSNRPIKTATDGSLLPGYKYLPPDLET